MAGEVRLVQPIRASRADLWRACSTPSGLEGWYADRSAGSFVRGGKVQLSWPDLSASVDLDVTDVVPEQHIAFKNGESRVTLEVGDGTVTLQHEGLTANDDVDGFRSSWRVGLALLRHSLEAQRGVARRTRWAVRPARTSTTLAHLCFTEPAALATWLGQEATMGAEGEPYALRLASGEHMSGRVLVRDGGRDVVLSWREQGDSVLVFRTLPSHKTNEERLLALCWSKWGPTEAGERGVENELRRALERLAGMLAQSGRA